MEMLQFIFYLRLAQLQLRVRNLYDNEPREGDKIGMWFRRVLQTDINVKEEASASILIVLFSPEDGCSRGFFFSKYWYLIYQTRRRHIPEGSNMCSRWHEILSFHILTETNALVTR